QVLARIECVEFRVSNFHLFFPSLGPCYEHLEVRAPGNHGFRSIVALPVPTLSRLCRRVNGTVSPVALKALGKGSLPVLTGCRSNNLFKSLRSHTADCQGVLQPPD